VTHDWLIEPLKSDRDEAWARTPHDRILAGDKSLAWASVPE
jgi:hypothetical protein